jgi:hypothetical protein
LAEAMPDSGQKGHGNRQVIDRQDCKNCELTKLQIANLGRAFQFCILAIFIFGNFHFPPALYLDVLHSAASRPKVRRFETVSRGGKAVQAGLAGTVERTFGDLFDDVIATSQAATERQSSRRGFG